MADDEDKSSKTEEPTAHKLNKLRDEGNVPRAKEVNNFFMLLAMFLAVLVAMPWQMTQLVDVYGAMIQNSGTTRILAADNIGEQMTGLIWRTLYTLGPVFVILMAFAYFGSVIQNGVIYSTKSIEPKLSKISLIKGFERLFSIKSVVEFLKSVMKLLIISAAVLLVYYINDDEILQLVNTNLNGIVEATFVMTLQMLMASLAVMSILAVMDYLFERQQYTKENRQSLKDIKDEVKDTQGDPYVKGRQRQIRQERAKQRMMQAVPESDVIITNPTHFAVALSYKPDTMDAPIVIAKGADYIALRIRQMGEDNDIPRYEDPPLARQLYADAEIGQEIPLDLFEAVAKVIAFINQIKKKKRRA